MSERKRIIITGSSGFLGTALVKYLLKTKKYYILGFDKNPSIISDKNFEEHKRDITKELPYGIDNVYAVIHLAAIPGVRESHEQFDSYAINNILGTQKILKKCIEEWKPKRFLFASSSSIYNEINQIYEGDDKKPLSPYAVSKITGEYLIDCYKRNGMLNGIDVTSMRIFTVYGPGQREQLAIQAFIQNILKDLPIEIHGDGFQERDFTYIDDFCSAVECLLDTDESFVRCYNICTGKYHNLHEIIKIIADITGKEIRISYEPKNIYDVKRTWGENDRLCKLGWEPKMDFVEGIKRQIEWNRKKPM